MLFIINVGGGVILINAADKEYWLGGIRYLELNN